MSNYNLTHFGNLDLQNLESYYAITIEHKERKVKLDLNFVMDKKIERQYIVALNTFLKELEEKEEWIKNYMHKDFYGHGETKNYIDSFLDNQDEEELISILHGTDKSLSKEEQLLEKIYLKRISLYPEKEDDVLAVLDYVINTNLSEDLLVVIFTKENEIKNITIESQS